MRRRTDVTRELADPAEQSVLRCFGNMERTEKDGLVEKVIGSAVRCVRHQ